MDCQWPAGWLKLIATAVHKHRFLIHARGQRNGRIKFSRSRFTICFSLSGEPILSILSHPVWREKEQRMRYTFSTVSGLIVLAISTSSLGAQASTNRTILSLGLAASSYRTSHPEGGPLGLGATVSIERWLSQRVSARAVVGATNGVSTADDIGVCHGVPGNCLPDAMFPKWLTTAELQGAFAAAVRVPLRLVGGVGFARSDGARENQRNAPVVSDSRTRGLWRAGIELSLGRSPRSPRLQLSRTGFSSSLHSTTFVDGAIFSIVPW